jgi:hypothetical protein
MSSSTSSATARFTVPLRKNFVFDAAAAARARAPAPSKPSRAHGVEAREDSGEDSASDDGDVDLEPEDERKRVTMQDVMAKHSRGFITLAAGRSRRRGALLWVAGGGARPVAQAAAGVHATAWTGAELRRDGCRSQSFAATETSRRTTFT